MKIEELDDKKSKMLKLFDVYKSNRKKILAYEKKLDKKIKQAKTMMKKIDSVNKKSIHQKKKKSLDK